MSLLLLFFLAAALKGALFYAKNSYSGRVLPQVFFRDIELGGKTKAEATELLTAVVRSHLHAPLPVVFGDRALSLTPYELGLESPLPALLNRLPVVGYATGDWEFLRALLFPRSVQAEPEIDAAVSLATLKNHFPEGFVEPEAPRFLREKNQIRIKQEVWGRRFDPEAVQSALLSDWSRLEVTPLKLQEIITVPSISGADLEKALPDLNAVLQKRLTLKRGMVSKSLFLGEDPAWYSADPLTKQLIVDPAVFWPWFEKELAPVFTRAKADVSITSSAGEIVFTGLAQTGEQVNRENFLIALNNALFASENNLELPMDLEPPQVTVSDDLRALGIKQLIGGGYTDFQGSTATRVHNIKVGLKRFNGVIVPQNSVFSFVNQLGPVDGEAGYQKELVIAGKETKKEFGGGLCQVSSTAFRAALFTGLPIVERSPHSYAVSYYARPGGQGLDATIYPGVKDLRFSNDTPGAVLLQAEIRGTLVYFNIYGTADGREVTIGNYRAWNWQAPPPEEVVYTADLPAGKQEVKEQAIKGFEAAWDRVITKNDATVTETISSRYRPWAKRTLIGVEAEKLPALQKGRSADSAPPELPI